MLMCREEAKAKQRCGNTGTPTHSKSLIREGQLKLENGLSRIYSYTVYGAIRQSSYHYNINIL